MKKAKITAEESMLLTPESPEQALAMRIWNGQSVTLSTRERVERIKRGLAEQGYTDLSVIELPAENFKRFL
jgi:hypothetical protein